MAFSILIVDSQRERIRTFQKTLERLQHRTILTGVISGEEGLLEARLNPVDLVIAHTNLPGMDIAALLDGIRAARPSARTILFTHTQQEHDRFHAKADVVLNPPFNADGLLEAIANLLEIPAAPPETNQPGETSPKESEDPATTISERLTKLRLDLEAETVILINDTGRILARAGSLPEHDLEPAVLPALMAAFSAGARISRFLGPTDQPNQYFYRGEKIHLVMSAVGHTWALVSATRHEPTGAHTAAIQTAVPDIASVLVQLGMPLLTEEQTQVPPFLMELDELEEEVAAEIDQRLEALLNETTPDHLDDADDFWDTGEEASVFEGMSTDALTYQQAVQLGLAPEEDGENSKQA